MVTNQKARNSYKLGCTSQPRAGPHLPILPICIAASFTCISLAMNLGQNVSNIAKLRFMRSLLCSHGRHAISSHSEIDMNPLFCYTSGRWLWNEREQLEARYRRINISNLQQAACHAVGAEKCISFKNIGEGNYNKAYRLEMEDGRRVIAKVPHPNADSLVFTTASEVATMEFARTVLDLPVPQVLAWSATDQNPVQAEYIIMEEANGSQLHEVWQDHYGRSVTLYENSLIWKVKCSQSHSKSKIHCVSQETVHYIQLT